MNPHVFWGVVSFTAWSTFATWYYVNYIKESDQVEPEPVVEVVEEVKAEETMAEPEAVEVIEEEKVEEPTSKPIKVAFEETVYFAKNSSQIQNQSAIKPILKGLDTLDETVKLSIQLTGHTCDLGSEQYNEQLALERAQEVKSELEQTKLSSVQWDLRSSGESNPVVPNYNESNRAKNRRVSVNVKSTP